ncbi:hypothetical protein IPJ72_00595 [Candidatus Peregrinibacteria bacterium]|nr:MAG: hypothetical protein IPJ72_00595 [Candidatus Peregrinibacteria bacterium]
MESMQAIVCNLALARACTRVALNESSVKPCRQTDISKALRHIEKKVNKPEKRVLLVYQINRTSNQYQVPIDQLVVAVINMVKNAQTHGKAESLSIEINAQETGLELSISDNGSGVDAANEEKYSTKVLPPGTPNITAV